MKKLIFRGPVMTASGYGVHARMLLKALMESGKFDITVMSVPWGATPLLYEKTPFLEKVRELSNKFNVKDPGQFDVSVQVTIPNEFEKFAPVNIGVTAGIESDKVSQEWINKCNEKIDLLVVPSKHSADGFIAAGGLKIPMITIPEWVDPEIFNTEPAKQSHIKFGCDFNFLAVGLGLDKPEGEDRKNFGQLIRWFCEQFRDRKDVGLVLKLSMVNYSEVDFARLQDHILQIKRRVGVNQFPQITLVHGRYGDHEFADLYKHPQIKALITLTHGEGYGLPIIEAAACGLPVIATNWSGHLDFLQIDGLNKFVPVDYTLQAIPQSAVWKGVMEEGTKWACPRESDAKLKMAKVHLSYNKPKQWAGELAEHIAKNYNPKTLGDLFVAHVDMAINRMTIDQPEKAETKTQVHPVVPNSDYSGFFAQVNEQYSRFSPNGEKTLLYTMPGSAGDVFVSTGVVSSLRKKFPQHKIIFATRPQYNDILRGNPDIDQIVPFEDWMANTRVLEFIFDEVFCPNFSVQTAGNNWIMNGAGRKLAEQFANHCLVDLGQMEIERHAVDGLPTEYIVFHPGAGKGQWGARNYQHWQEVVDVIRSATNLPVVQVGASDDAVYKGVIDFRGKTTYNQLAEVIFNARLLLGIDSFPMHLAAAFKVPSVNIFGSSTPGSTGPVNPSFDSVMIETTDRYTCKKPCYLETCILNPRRPCINNISVNQIINTVMETLG